MIGYQTSLTADKLNLQLGEAAVGLRNAAANIMQLFEQVNELGVAGLQAAPFSMAQPDAQAFFDACNYMQTVAGIYYGNATQGSTYNFHNALVAARGGQ